jgi:hypothetical protein
MFASVLTNDFARPDYALILVPYIIAVFAAAVNNVLLTVI